MVVLQSKWNSIVILFAISTEKIAAQYQKFVFFDLNTISYCKIFYECDMNLKFYCSEIGVPFFLQVHISLWLMLLLLCIDEIVPI